MHDTPAWSTAMSVLPIGVAMRTVPERLVPAGLAVILKVADVALLDCNEMCAPLSTLGVNVHPAGAVTFTVKFCAFAFSEKLGGVTL